MIATVDPSRSAPAGRASRIACGGAGSDDDAVCLPPDALHHQALGQQPAARHERGHENDPPADQREPPRVIESAPEPKMDHPVSLRSKGLLRRSACNPAADSHSTAATAPPWPS